jgi:ATP/maltotriose-dependent transcriptional regulator MalT
VIAGSAAVEGHSIIGGDFPGVRLGLVEATESALELGDLDTAEQLLAVVDGFGVGDSTPGTRAQSLRLHARLADARGELDAVEQGFKAAAGLLREIGIPFWLAITELERAEWLLRQGRPEDARRLLDEPRETFERLQAQPWSERVQQAMIRVGAVTEGAR